MQRGRRPENSSGRIVPELFSGRCFLEGTDPPQCDIIIEEKPIKSKSLNDNIAEHMKSTIDSFWKYWKYLKLYWEYSSIENVQNAQLFMF